ncbi:MAG: enoyl-CoA hydratase/isomerase family protein [Acidimicrobiia bacterium]|nr:enoyl-CoA hydratase/isomerase family protein [Acidimicrobiia bacterium]
MAIDLEQLGEVQIVRWDDGENRVNLDSMTEWHAALDQLEAIEGPLAVVVTGAGKFFSNGLDLDRFAAAPEEAGPTVDLLTRLFGRMLLLPAYTVAALNGHTFAAGAMLSCCFDVRVMRADRGYWCLPEVDLGLPLSEAMAAVVTARIPMEAAQDAIMTGRRYSAEDAMALGIVTDTSDEARLLNLAVDLASPMAGKDRRVIGEHKRLLFGRVAALCGVHSDS